MALRVIFVLLFAFLVYYCIGMFVSKLEEKIKQIYATRKQILELEEENRKQIYATRKQILELEEENRKQIANRKTWLSKFWS
jgi:F0F1-type ATP synthase membrane subunit b/b'